MWRPFDVEAVVACLPFPHASVAAGGGGLDRPVKGAGIASRPEHLWRLPADELAVTTTAVLLGAGDDHDKVVARLHAAGVSGVAVQVAAHQPLPDELVVAADRLSFPLLTFPEEAPPAGIASAILDALLAAQRRRLERMFALERFASISLEELIAGHAGRVAEIAERAAGFGWDLGRPRAVLLASVDPPEEGVIPPRALDTIAATARATLGHDAIVWTRSTTIAALVAPETPGRHERRRIAEALRAELDERVRSVSVSIGVGRRVDSPEDLPRSFAEASRAVEVGRWARGRHVIELFDDLGLERILAATPPADLAEFVQQAIGALVEHDRAHTTDLVATLAVWLETRNMAEAARRMYVHYNTMKNRIDRIEEIVGPVVTDAGRALECEVAIYIDRHYGPVEF